MPKTAQFPILTSFTAVIKTPSYVRQGKYASVSSGYKKCDVVSGLGTPQCRTCRQPPGHCQVEDSVLCIRLWQLGTGLCGKVLYLELKSLLLSRYFILYRYFIIKMFKGDQEFTLTLMPFKPKYLDAWIGPQGGECLTKCYHNNFQRQLSQLLTAFISYEFEVYQGCQGCIMMSFLVR